MYLLYGAISSTPTRHKYDLAYYIKLAKELEKSGADILCIKDMAGLLRPFAASKLIATLKQETNLAIHLHTHATAGNSEAMLIAAVEAGCDIIDGAVSSMSKVLALSLVSTPW